MLSHSYPTTRNLLNPFPSLLNTAPDHRTAINEAMEEIQKNPTQKLTDVAIKNLMVASQFFLNIGYQKNNKDIIRAATISKSLVSMYDAYNEFTALKSTITTIAAGSQALSFFSALGPVSIAAQAGWAIYSLFKKKKQKSQPDPMVTYLSQHFRMLSEQMLHISEQVHAVHEETREVHIKVQQSLENQRLILGQLVELFQLIEDSYSDLSHKLSDVQSRLAQIEARVMAGLIDISSQPYRKLSNEIEDWIEDRTGNASNPDRIINLANEVAPWLRTKEDGTPPETARPLYTGVDFALGTNSSTELNKKIDSDILPEVTLDSVMNIRGFLAYYAEVVLKKPASPASSFYKHLVDPILWSDMIDRYIDLRVKFGDKILDPALKNLDGIIKTVEINLAHQQCEQKNIAVFDELSSRFQICLNTMNDVYEQEIDAENKSIKNKFNIRHLISDIIASYKKRIPNITISCSEPIKRYVKSGFRFRHPMTMQTMISNGHANQLTTEITEQGSDITYQYLTYHNSQQLGRYIISKDFPEEFMACDDIQLGALTGTYKQTDIRPLELGEILHVRGGNYPFYAVRTSTIKFAFHNEEKEIIECMQISQVLKQGAMQQTGEVINITNREKAKEAFSQAILKMRKTALIKASTKLEPFLIELSALRKLMYAYAIDRGCTQPALNLLDQLPNPAHIIRDIKHFIENGTADTAIPSFHMIIQNRMTQFVDHIKDNSSMSPLEKSFRITLYQLQHLKEVELERLKQKELNLLSDKQEAKETNPSEKLVIKTIEEARTMGKQLACFLIITGLQTNKFDKAAALLQTKLSSQEILLEDDQLSEAVLRGLMEAFQENASIAAEILLDDSVNEIKAARWLLKSSREYVSQSQAGFPGLRFLSAASWSHASNEVKAENNITLSSRASH
jgi:hypothetical protein